GPHERRRPPRPGRLSAALCPGRQCRAGTRCSGAWRRSPRPAPVDDTTAAPRTRPGRAAPPAPCPSHRRLRLPGARPYPAYNVEGRSTEETFLITWQQAVAAAVIGYLLGAIPTGIIVARLYGNVDLTAHGSGRTGATNV